MVTDYYIHDYINSIPLVGSYVDFINSNINNIYSWFNNLFIDSSVNADNINNGITRSNSSSSDVTVVPNNIQSPTPRLPDSNNPLITPPSTPNPWD